MKYIDSNSLNPYFNLALEEYILKNRNIKEDIVFLWQNTPTIVVGNNQNTIEEVNMPFVNERNIKVVRRLSGGGAVYQDLGNLNFTFLKRLSKPSNLDIKKFALPVVVALNKLGIPAQLTGRNDISVEGKKISGNAQRLFRNKLLHHGTLLFDTDLELMAKVLQVGVDKIQSKGIKSIRSRVTNLKPYFKQQITIEEFRESILSELFHGEKVNQYFLSEEDLVKINELVDNKYSTWEWNFGYSPPYSIKNARRFSGGKVEVFIDVEKGTIKNCQIFGDFLSLCDVSEVEKALQSKRYESETIEKILSRFNLKYYFGNITLPEIMTVFFG
ncbi:MAG: lipoate--protein ligase [Atribacterota bacterium]|jgi:lipoate-protein ligase A|nr:lipoate--protein ligase [Atribacterota bacterium]MDD4895458.1 lipoate--protein ligase [Atribacterota bacterium]MDD5637635.1 lipoate--protein ligase [Atribacterota bacterium]